MAEIIAPNVNDCSVDTFEYFIIQINKKYNIDDDFMDEVISHFKYYYSICSKDIDYESIQYEIALSESEIDLYVYYACYLISHKFHCDIAFDNVEINKIFKKDVKAINFMEVYCLKKMDYKLMIATSEYMDIDSYFSEYHTPSLNRYVDNQISDENCDYYTSRCEHVVIDMISYLFNYQTGSV